VTLSEKRNESGPDRTQQPGKAVIPALNGLVLTGGKSVRMGTAKEKLDYHGKEQQYYAADLLSAFCDQVFISCRADQVEGIHPEYGYQALPDSFLNMGPVSGILSAFRREFKKEQKHAWLVVACDLPLLTRDTLQYLVDHRNPSVIATAFKSSSDGLPEPLMTIWEPGSYAVLLARLAQDNTCPRKALIEHNVPLLDLIDKEALLNVNTPEESERVQGFIQNNGGPLNSTI